MNGILYIHKHQIGTAREPRVLSPKSSTQTTRSNPNKPKENIITACALSLEKSFTVVTGPYARYHAKLFGLPRVRFRTGDRSMAIYRLQYIRIYLYFSWFYPDKSYIRVLSGCSRFSLKFQQGPQRRILIRWSVCARYFVEVIPVIPAARVKCRSSFLYSGLCLRFYAKSKIGWKALSMVDRVYIRIIWNYSWNNLKRVIGPLSKFYWHIFFFFFLLFFFIQVSLANRFMQGLRSILNIFHDTFASLSEIARPPSGSIIRTHFFFNSLDKPLRGTIGLSPCFFFFFLRNFYPSLREQVQCHERHTPGIQYDSFSFSIFPHNALEMFIGLFPKMSPQHLKKSLEWSARMVKRYWGASFIFPMKY